jgi:hypothetical protein
METPSSLLLRRNDTSCILLVLVCALGACGDDNGAMGPDNGGAADATAETSIGQPDASRPETGGGGSPDAPSTMPDAPARDGAGGSGGTGGAGGAGGASGARDGATVDNTMPPASDARSDVTADTDTGTGDTGTGVDAGRPDVTTIDASADATSDATGPTSDATATCTLCLSYGPAEQAGKITTSTLNALSGIGVSKRNAGVVYVHNDRNVAQFFAVSEAGALLGTFNLTGGTVEDIEDMAVAHCPSGSCVYIADIGGNISPRTQFGVVRSPEPEVNVAVPGGTTSIAAEKLVFTYPDNANHNAESMLVDPNSDTIYVITKVAAGMPSAVYKFPMTFGGSTLTAEKVVDLTVPKSTDKEAVSASAHPCAPAFLLRTYNTLYEFRAPSGSMLEAAFSATPTVVPVATESQGEGVAYRPDGRGYFTTTEGSQPPLNRVSCP